MKLPLPGSVDGKIALPNGYAAKNALLPIFFLSIKIFSFRLN